MEPLDDRIKRDKFDIGAFDKSIIGGLSQRRPAFALPYDFGPLVVFYNDDLFEKDGVAGAEGRLDRMPTSSRPRRR